MTTALAPRPGTPVPAAAAEAARIAELVALRNRIDAEIAEEVRAFARAAVEARLEQIAAEQVTVEQVEATVVDRLGRALRVSPTRARAQLRIGRDLHAGLDRVRTSYGAGELDQPKVAAIVAAAAGLDAGERAEVDRRLSSYDLPSLGLRRVADLARTIVAEVAPEKFAERARAARRDRHVTISPAGDGMALLRAYLPAEQGVTCYAALRKAVTEHWVGSEPVTRTRGQIMADTLVERLTGAAPTEAAAAVELQVLVPVESLVDTAGGPLPVELPGFGPVPAEFLVEPGRATWRRLVTREGVVIGADSRRRTFTGVLAEVIRSRDRGRCTAPHCDAPIEHLDHLHRWSEGGSTTLENGAGRCAFHNLVREIPP
ncbi:HNH endonuclease signature motif containing protein [Pseudonocardia ailaonensis]|uniref:HNH endonuclease signature motif containing protein n=1 Tax=Pseudonocardia ailaonensis TaxID=367279 RepID=A0ABN2MSR9_9PSEU